MNGNLYSATVSVICLHWNHAQHNSHIMPSHCSWAVVKVYFIHNICSCWYNLNHVVQLQSIKVSTRLQSPVVITLIYDWLLESNYIYICLSCNRGVSSIKTYGCTIILHDLVKNHITLDSLIIKINTLTSYYNNLLLCIIVNLHTYRPAFNRVLTIAGDCLQQIREVSTANSKQQL